MLQPPRDSSPPDDARTPGEPRVDADALEHILEQQGSLVFAHSQPYRRLLVTHCPDSENPRGDGTLTDFLTLPVLQTEHNGTQIFDWNGKEIEGLDRFPPELGLYDKDAEARAYRIGDESLDSAAIAERMQDCTAQGGQARLVWAGARPGGGVELHLGTRSRDEAPPLAPDGAVPVGAMTLAAHHLLDALSMYAGDPGGESVSPALLGLQIMTGELEAYSAYANDSIHVVELQSLNPADLLAGRDVAWTTDLEEMVGDAATAFEVVAELFHARNDDVTDLVAAHIPV